MAILRRTLSLILGLLSIAVALGFSDFIFDEKYLMGSMLLGLSFLVAYLSYVVSPSKSFLRSFGPLLITIGLFQLASNFYFKTTVNAWFVSSLMYYSVVAFNSTMVFLGIIACVRAPKLDKPISTRRPVRIDFFFWTTILSMVVALYLSVFSSTYDNVPKYLDMILILGFCLSFYSLYLMMKGMKRGRVLYTGLLCIGAVNSVVLFFYVSPGIENLPVSVVASTLSTIAYISILYTKNMNLYFERAKINSFDFFKGSMVKLGNS